MQADTGLSGLSAICGRAVYLYDTFTDTNGTNLNAHTMNIGPGWTSIFGNWQIQSNTAQSPTSGYINASDASHPDGIVTVKFALAVANASHTFYIAGRVQDSSNYIKIIAKGDGTLLIIERNAGTDTTRATGAWAGDTAQHTMTATFNGSTVSVQIDSGTVLSYSAETFQQTLTKFGIDADWATTTPTVYSFQVTSL